MPKFTSHISSLLDTPDGISTSGFEKTITQQHFAEECDINSIMQKYEKTGMLPQIDGKQIFGDFTDVTSYDRAIEQIANAEEQFMHLPAKLRAHFDNDPSKLLQFIQNLRTRYKSD